jgi:response regulator of citrate/malate metabolism
MRITGECTLARILVVEDEEQVRVLAESYLREQAHQTLSAATMEQALAVLGVTDGIDLLFVDVGLYDDRHVAWTWRGTLSNVRQGCGSCIRPDRRLRME